MLGRNRSRNRFTGIASGGSGPTANLLKNQGMTLVNAGSPLANG